MKYCRSGTTPSNRNCEVVLARSLSVEEQDLLTEYAVAPRYPGWREVPLAEARRAVALARRVRKHVRSLLPKEALQQKKR